MTNDHEDKTEQSEGGQPSLTEQAQETPDTPFLQRWSARKIQAKSSGDQAEGVDGLTVQSEAAPQTEPEPPVELTDADMPPLESIDATTDMSGFFSPKVSAELRRLALHKLFHLPSYNIRDGLDDYDDDYTKFEPLGDIVTSDMKHMQRVAERKRLEKLAEQEALADRQHTPAPAADQAQIPTEEQTAAEQEQPEDDRPDKPDNAPEQTGTEHTQTTPPEDSQKQDQESLT